jgi:hypothetical protein
LATIQAHVAAQLHPNILSPRAILTAGRKRDMTKRIHAAAKSRLVVRDMTNLAPNPKVFATAILLTISPTFENLHHRATFPRNGCATPGSRLGIGCLTSNDTDGFCYFAPPSGRDFARLLRSSRGQKIDYTCSFSRSSHDRLELQFGLPRQFKWIQ